MNIKELRERMQAALKAARDIADAAEKGDRDFSEEERADLQRHLKEAADLKVRIKAADADADLRKQISDLGAGLEMVERPSGIVEAVAAGKGRTLGERFVNAPEIKEFLGRFPNGRIPESTKGLMSPPVAFKTLLTGLSDTSAGAFVATDVTGIYEPLGRRPLTVRDLVTNLTTESDTVEFVRQTAKITQAVPVAESNVTTYAGSTGQVEGAKPEGAMAFERVTETVKTIAVWIPATKRALSDAGQLRGLIDSELRADLEEDLEDEIVAGSGSGEHFTGILNTSNVLTQAWDTDMLTTIRKARTAVTVTGRSRPTALLVHPNDAEALDLLKDLQGRYYFGGPADGGAARVWRVPVVECEALTEGEALLGDFRKAIIWDREQASISISDSHEDFFVRNMVAILGEMRAAFGVRRPSAFCKVDLTAGS